MEIKTITENNETYYYANNIARHLGYSKPSNAIIAHCLSPIKQDIEIDNNGKKQIVTAKFINKSDVLTLISKSKKATQEEKTKLIEKLNIKDDIVLTSRFEIEFFKGLELVLSQMNIEIELQKNILNYRIDGYIQKYNLAIEYDEEQHIRQQEEDKQREEEIKNVLGCKFIRLDYKDNDFINIGKVLKAIM